MFWFVVAAVLVLVLGYMWRYDRRTNARVDTRTPDSARGQGMGATYARPPINPNDPSSF